MELGINGLGQVAENHHVGPMHPEYADLPKIEADPAAAKAMLEEAGLSDVEIELISIDGDWRMVTTDAIGAQLRDAGFNVKRTIIPGATFWNDWTKYAFSTTNWGARPLGVQVYGLAYKSGEAWNEFGWANEEFDALLADALAIADVDKRREVVAKAEKLIQDEGVTIQPYWRTLTNFTKKNLGGAGHHISFEFHPDEVYWKA